MRTKNWRWGKWRVGVEIRGFHFGDNPFKKMLATRSRRHKVTLNEPDAKAILPDRYGLQAE